MRNRSYLAVLLAIAAICVISLLAAIFGAVTASLLVWGFCFIVTLMYFVLCPPTDDPHAEWRAGCGERR